MRIDGLTCAYCCIVSVNFGIFVFKAVAVVVFTRSCHCLYNQEFNPQPSGPEILLASAYALARYIQEDPSLLISDYKAIRDQNRLKNVM